MAADGPRERLTFLAYRAASATARRLPPWVGAAELGALAMAAAMPRRRRLVGSHLQRVSEGRLAGPALSLAVLRAFVSYGRYWRDSFRLPGLGREELEAHVSFEGFENLQAGLDRGRGVILALPHLGSWDYGGAWLAAIGHPMTVVVEPLPGEGLSEWFYARRRAMGLTVVPLGPKAVREVLACLKEGGVVGLVSDRDLGGGGTTVSFFGEQTTLPAGPATLALRTGATLLPAAVIDLPGGRHHAILRPPLDTTRRGPVHQDVSRITAALAGEMEALIRRAPEQWHLFQPNWPSDPR